MNEEMDSPNRVWQLLRREFCSQSRGGEWEFEGRLDGGKYGEGRLEGRWMSQEVQ